MLLGRAFHKVAAATTNELSHTFPQPASRDGASRCGVLVAASYILEHLKIEQEVDVFHAVQHVRTTRPQLVTDLVSGPLVRTVT